MNAMEIISLIAAIAVFFKLIMFMVHPKWLDKIVKVATKKTKLFVWLLLVLIIVLSYFILASMTITQAVPVIILGHFILALMLLQFPKIYEDLAKAIIKNPKKVWLGWLVWVIILVWTLYVLFI